MYIVKALVEATAPDLPGRDVNWTVGQVRHVHESLIQQYKNNPLAWIVLEEGTTETPTTKEFTRKHTGITDELEASPVTYIRRILLGRAPRPIIVGAGSLSSGGLFTLTNALSTYYTEPTSDMPVDLWLPAGAAGPAAGLYEGNFASDTTIQLVSGSFAAASYAPPNDPTYITIYTALIRGGMLGPNGIVKLVTREFHGGTTAANNRKVELYLDGNRLGGPSNAGASYGVRETLASFCNRGVENKQLGRTYDILSASAINAAPAFTSVDTTVNKYVTVRVSLQNGAVDNLAVDYLELELTPS
jgi:hypothetical protein